jgi:hypothetical protein
LRTLYTYESGTHSLGADEESAFSVFDATLVASLLDLIDDIFAQSQSPQYQPYVPAPPYFQSIKWLKMRMINFTAIVEKDVNGISWMGA